MAPEQESRTRPTERYYVCEKENRTVTYALPADEKERRRLDLQSHVINKLFDDKLIWAPITLKDGDAILDSGTGSGHWLLTLASQLPEGNTISLYGLDISSRMFPSQNSTTSNMSFHTGDITSLPTTWSSTFTLIHQRLLFSALQVNQWKLALSEIYRTLRPGGWVQLCEPDYILETPDNAIRNHILFQISTTLLVDVRGVNLDIVGELPAWLEECGFINVTKEKRGMPLGSWAGEFGRACAKGTLDAFNGIQPFAMKHGAFGFYQTEEEYEEGVRDLKNLCDETPGTYFEYHLFLAQKPVGGYNNL